MEATSSNIHLRNQHMPPVPRRLYMLEGQCDVWTGVISAAVYVALVEGRAVSVPLSGNEAPALVDLAEVQSAVLKFHAQAERRGLCKLDLQLISQEVESVWLSGLYPVNAMRNRALAGASTEVVLLLDVDFWPSAELSELMVNARKYGSLLQAVLARTAVVLPAFESGETGAVGVEQAREAVLRGKAGAAAMSRDGRLKPFHTDRYRAGHRATDYARWAQARQPYAVRYEEGYEPYVLVARRHVPWYDERFIGYRKNKVVHLLHLHSLGLRFVAHPNAFVVHSPHPRARTWKVTRKTGLWDQLAAIYDDVKAALARGSYVPASLYACGDHLVGPLLRQTSLPDAVAEAQEERRRQQQREQQQEQAQEQSRGAIAA